MQMLKFTVFITKWELPNRRRSREYRHNCRRENKRKLFTRRNKGIQEKAHAYLPFKHNWSAWRKVPGGLKWSSKIAVVGKGRIIYPKKAGCRKFYGSFVYWRGGLFFGTNGSKVAKNHAFGQIPHYLFNRWFSRTLWSNKEQSRSKAFLFRFYSSPPADAPCSNRTDLPLV